MGDFNIDLLKHNDTIASHHFLPAISLLQPTRIATTTSKLIGNMFTNMWPRSVNSSIIVADIYYHLPVIAWFDHQPLTFNKPSSASISVINDQLKDLFKVLLEQCDFTSRPIKSAKWAYDLSTDLLKTAYSKAFP